MDHFLFTLQSSLGSFYANESDELSSEGYAAKFSSIGTGDFKWHKLEGIFYTEGQMKDFEINGWTFSYRIEGLHRIYNIADPDSPEFTIKGLDPHQQVFEARVYTFGFFKEACADFMNEIHFYSKFPDRDIAQAFNKLKNRLKGSNIDKEMNNLLPLIQEIRSFYSTHRTNNEAKFYDQIKLELNAAIDDYVKQLNKLKM